MNKILSTTLGLVLTVTGLVLSPFGVPPASAECGFTQTDYGDLKTWTDSIQGDDQAAKITYKGRTLVQWKVCGRRAPVPHVYVNLWVNPPACSNNNVDGWRVNGNYIGNYNPPTQFQGCDSSKSFYQFPWHPNVKVRKGASADKKCFGATVEEVLNARFNKTTLLPSACVRFS